MLLFVFLPLLVATEWVEITQNYRKEYKPTRHDTNSKNIYSNNSILEHQWSKGYVHRINNPSIKRIQTNERKSSNIERYPYKDFISTEESEHNSQIRNLEIFHDNAYQVSILNQRTTNGNKHESSKVSETKTINTKIRPDTNEKDNKQSVENTKVFQNNIEKGNVGNNEESFFNTETTPCPDVVTNFERNDVKNKSNKQNHTLNREEKIKTKTSAMETLVKFLKVVSQTIKLGTRRTFKSKLRYLEDLRDSLLADIDTRIESAFPDDDERRQRRAAGVSRGHVEFPSSESALMTISFLTFAVFLIKLVLQVIHTYKAKTMMVTPAVVATVGRAVFKKSTHN
ncbi:PREDICTED: uncharacterized protein LOC106100930 [Papilio polytes]|uniref:uncharacterized protein LOC106100930 n=1 Tax=Papilio polytes TaxID=76194 RepID=UPI0006762967|nr:PREDICTED: uncharacterized protein LOC106100930 [Papilio polytes]